MAPQSFTTYLADEEAKAQASLTAMGGPPPGYAAYGPPPPPPQEAPPPPPPQEAPPPQSAPYAASPPPQEAPPPPSSGYAPPYAPSPPPVASLPAAPPPMGAVGGPPRGYAPAPSPAQAQPPPAAVAPHPDRAQPPESVPVDAWGPAPATQTAAPLPQAPPGAPLPPPPLHRAGPVPVIEQPPPSGDRARGGSAPVPIEAWGPEPATITTPPRRVTQGEPPAPTTMLPPRAPVSALPSFRDNAPASGLAIGEFGPLSPAEDEVPWVPINSMPLTAPPGGTDWRTTSQGVMPGGAPPSDAVTQELLQQQKVIANTKAREAAAAGRVQGERVAAGIAESGPSSLTSFDLQGRPNTAGVPGTPDYATGRATSPFAIEGPASIPYPPAPPGAAAAEAAGSPGRAARDLAAEALAPAGATTQMVLGDVGVATEPGRKTIATGAGIVDSAGSLGINALGDVATSPQAQMAGAVVPAFIPGGEAARAVTDRVVKPVIDQAGSGGFSSVKDALGALASGASDAQNAPSQAVINEYMERAYRYHKFGENPDGYVPGTSSDNWEDAFRSNFPAGSIPAQFRDFFTPESAAWVVETYERDGAAGPWNAFHKDNPVAEAVHRLTVDPLTALEFAPAALRGVAGLIRTVAPVRGAGVARAAEAGSNVVETAVEFPLNLVGRAKPFRPTAEQALTTDVNTGREYVESGLGARRAGGMTATPGTVIPPVGPTVGPTFRPGSGGRRGTGPRATGSPTPGTAAPTPGPTRGPGAPTEAGINLGDGYWLHNPVPGSAWVDTPDGRRSPLFTDPDKAEAWRYHDTIPGPGAPTTAPGTTSTRGPGAPTGPVPGMVTPAGRPVPGAPPRPPATRNEIASHTGAQGRIALVHEVDGSFTIETPNPADRMTGLDGARAERVFQQMGGGQLGDMPVTGRTTAEPTPTGGARLTSPGVGGRDATGSVAGSAPASTEIWTTNRIQQDEGLGWQEANAEARRRNAPIIAGQTDPATANPDAYYAMLPNGRNQTLEITAGGLPPRLSGSGNQSFFISPESARAGQFTPEEAAQAAAYADVLREMGYELGPWTFQPRNHIAAAQLIRIPGATASPAAREAMLQKLTFNHTNDGMAPNAAATQAAREVEGILGPAAPGVNTPIVTGRAPAEASPTVSTRMTSPGVGGRDATGSAIGPAPTTTRPSEPNLDRREGYTAGRGVGIVGEDEIEAAATRINDAIVAAAISGLDPVRIRVRNLIGQLDDLSEDLWRPGSTGSSARQSAATLLDDALDGVGDTVGLEDVRTRLEGLRTIFERRGWTEPRSTATGSATGPAPRVETAPPTLPPATNGRVWEEIGQTPGGNSIQRQVVPNDTTGFLNAFNHSEEVIGGRFVVTQPNLGGDWIVYDLTDPAKRPIASFPQEMATIKDGIATQPARVKARVAADDLIAGRGQPTPTGPVAAGGKAAPTTSVTRTAPTPSEVVNGTWTTPGGRVVDLDALSPDELDDIMDDPTGWIRRQPWAEEEARSAGANAGMWAEDFEPPAGAAPAARDATSRETGPTASRPTPPRHTASVEGSEGSWEVVRGDGVVLGRTRNRADADRMAKAHNEGAPTTPATRSTPEAAPGRPGDPDPSTIRLTGPPGRVRTGQSPDGRWWVVDPTTSRIVADGGGDLTIAERRTAALNAQLDARAAARGTTPPAGNGAVRRGNAKPDTGTTFTTKPPDMHPATWRVVEPIASPDTRKFVRTVIEAADDVTYRRHMSAGYRGGVLRANPGLRDAIHQARAEIHGTGSTMPSPSAGPLNSRIQQGPPATRDDTADAVGEVEADEAIHARLEGLGLGDLASPSVSDELAGRVFPKPANWERNAGGVWLKKGERGLDQDAIIINRALHNWGGWGQVLDHEAVHAMRSRGAIAPTEWNAIVNAAKTTISPRHKTGATYHRAAEESHGVAYSDRLERRDLLEEEAGANMFADWRAGILKLGPTDPLGRIFQKIEDFIRRFVATMRGQEAGVRVEDVFNRMASGEVGSRRRNLYPPGDRDIDWGGGSPSPALPSPSAGTSPPTTDRTPRRRLQGIGDTILNRAAAPGELAQVAARNAVDDARIGTTPFHLGSIEREWGGVVLAPEEAAAFAKRVDGVRIGDHAALAQDELDWARWFMRQPPANQLAPADLAKLEGINRKFAEPVPNQPGQLRAPDFRNLTDQEIDTMASFHTAGVLETGLRLERGMKAAGAQPNMFLRGFDSFLSFRRSTALYNPARGPAYVLMQLMGNALNPGLWTKGGALRGYFTPTDWRAQWQRNRNYPSPTPSKTDTTRKNMGFAPSSKIREVNRDELSGGGTWFEEQGRPPLVRELGNWLIAPGGFRDAANVFDGQLREAVWKASFDAMMPTARRELRSHAADTAERMIRTGATTRVNPKAINPLLDNFYARTGGEFTADALRTELKTLAPGDEAVANWADRVARDWREASVKMDTKAKKEVDRYAFSFEETNLDAPLRRIFMFHHWMSRASKLYVTEAIKHPALGAAYFRTVEMLEQYAEEHGLPDWQKNWIQVQKTPFGLTTAMNPVSLLTSYFTFSEMNKKSNRELSAVGKARYETPILSDMMFNPVLDFVAGALGVYGKDVGYADVLGDTAGSNAVIDGLNAMNAQGMLGDLFKDAQGNPMPIPYVQSRDLFNWVQQQTTGLMSRASEGRVPQVTDLDPNRYGELDRRNIIADKIAEQNPELTARAEAGDGAAIQEFTTLVGEAMYDEANPVYQEAYRIQASMKAGIFSDVLPGGWGTLLGTVLNRAIPLEKFTSVTSADERRARGDEGMETELDKQLGYTIDAGDKQDVDYGQSVDGYYAIGSERGERARVLNDHYWGIAKSEPGGSIRIGGMTYTPQQITAMDESARYDLADQWLAGIGAQHGFDAAAEVETYRATREKYVAEHPEIAGYLGLRQHAESYPAGVDQFIAETAARNTPYRSYLEGSTSPPGSDAYRKRALGTQAYQAIIGEKDSIWGSADKTGAGFVAGLPGSTAGEDTLANEYYRKKAEDDAARAERDAEWQATVDGIEVALSDFDTQLEEREDFIFLHYGQEGVDYYRARVADGEKIYYGDMYTVMKNQYGDDIKPYAEGEHGDTAYYYWRDRYTGETTLGIAEWRRQSNAEWAKKQEATTASFDPNTELAGVAPITTQQASGLVAPRASSAAQEATVNVDGLNLRAAPGTDQAVLGTLAGGTSVRVTGPAVDGWVPVEIDGVAGFLAEQYLGMGAVVSSQAQSPYTAYTAP